MTGGIVLVVAPRACADVEPGSKVRCTTNRSSVDRTIVQPFARAAPMANPLTSVRLAPGITICGRFVVSNDSETSWFPAHPASNQPLSANILTVENERTFTRISP